MADKSESFDKNQLRFFLVCHLATNVLPVQLRSIFVSLWNNLFSNNYGEWLNSSKNGQDFVSMESASNQRRNQDMLNEMRNGDVRNWDCTKLFYAILYSTSIGQNLTPSVRGFVDQLRVFRNKSFAHVHKGELTAAEYQIVLNQILQALVGLQCDTSPVKEAQNLKSFSSDEVMELKEKMRQEKEAQAEVDMRLSSIESRLSTLENNIPPVIETDEVHVYSNLLVNEPVASQANATSFSSLPDKPNHAVIKRKQTDDVVKVLRDLKALHCEKITAVTIVGQPCSGKSECARNVGTILEEEGFANIATLHAGTFQMFSHSLEKLASKLGVGLVTTPPLNKASAPSVREMLWLSVEEKLSSLSSWFIIVDGVTEETKELLNLIPEPGRPGSGQILVTTQDHSVFIESPYSVCVNIERLSLGEAMMLLNVLDVDEIPEDLAEFIADILDFNPGFIVSCVKKAKDVSRQSKITLVDSLIQIVENIKNIKKEEEWSYYVASLDEVARSYLEYVMKTLIGRSSIVEECLYLCVLAGGNEISATAVTQHISSTFKMPISEINDALRNISLIKIDAENICINGVFYRILNDVFHSKEFTKKHLIFRLRKLCLFSVTRCCDTDVARMFKTMSQNILQHVSLLDLSFPNSEELCGLYHDLGKALLCVLVDYASAMRCFTTAMSISERSNATTGSGYAEILSSLGNLLRLTGNMKDASRYLNRSLTLFQDDAASIVSEDFARCLSSLGLVCLSQGNLDRARQLHNRALSIRQQLYGDDHVTTATSLNNIGGVYHECGDLAKAKSYYWKALEIKGRNFGWDSPYMANSFNNIAEISHEQGELRDAILIHNRALKIRQRLHGDDHPDVSDSLHNIAVVHHKLRELSTARKYHMRALEIRKKIYGENHLEVASSLSNLGEVHYDEGDLAAAENCHIQALCIRHLHSVTSWHPRVITCLNNLMLVYIADEKFSLATEYAYERFKLCEKVHGIRDTRTVEALRQLIDLSQRTCEGRSFHLPPNVFEQVERLSCV